MYFFLLELVCSNLPEIQNGRIATNLPGILEFDDEAKIVCDPGFRSNGAETVKCLADQKLSDVPKCADIDECSEQTANCPSKSTICKNMPGGYFCECKSGFQSQKCN